MTDISKEAVERLAKHFDQLHPKVETFTVFASTGLDVAATLRAQSARITELEAALETARNDALDAAKVSAEDRENIVDEIESIICETHEMDVRDVDYAENIVSWLERHHPAALRAISEDSQ